MWIPFFSKSSMHRIPVVYEPMKEMGKLAGEDGVKKIKIKIEKIPVQNADDANMTLNDFL